MRTQKTFSERFMKLPTDTERWRFIKENVKAWCKELDAEIEQAEARNQQLEARSQHIEAWLNLYKLNPKIAIRNTHMGIVISSKLQQ